MAWFDPRTGQVYSDVPDDPKKWFEYKDKGDPSSPSPLLHRFSDLTQEQMKSNTMPPLGSDPKTWSPTGITGTDPQASYGYQDPSNILSKKQLWDGMIK